MTRDEFFNWCINDVEGERTPNGLTDFVRDIEGKRTWIATLEETEEDGKMLWINWSEVYYPLIEFYSMTEPEVTEYLKQRFNVHLIGRFPSLRRLTLVEKGDPRINGV